MSAPKAPRPAPLVTSDVDISSLSYMPLFIARLRGSKLWLITRRKPELFRPMFSMWMRAYQERPAGSLEADDDVLADAAELGFEAWVDAKPDLMRGWILCSDNRYYHPVLAEIVKQSYEKTVLPNKLRTNAATEARLRKHRDKAVTDTSRPRDESRDEARRGPPRPPGREVGREVGRKEPPQNGAHAPQNGNTHPRIAFLGAHADLRHDRPVEDPTAAKLVADLGITTVEQLETRREEFETAYASAAVQH